MQLSSVTVSEVFFLKNSYRIKLASAILAPATGINQTFKQMTT